MLSFAPLFESSPFFNPFNLLNPLAVAFSPLPPSPKGLESLTQRQQGLSRSLDTALAQQQLSLCYQPQLDLRANTLVGMEALVRWYHPQWGAISPAEFIPLAERGGQIVSIGYWVLTQACIQYQNWQKQGFPSFKIAVNLSRKQLSQPELVHRIQEILRVTQMPPQYLQLEVTESLLLDNVDQAISVLEQLNGLGVQVAIDDFGTGYSSLSVLKHLPIQTLKIDKSFLDGLKVLDKSHVILESIIDLGHRLQLNVIAEGVENQEQFKLLKFLHCDVIQGYFYSPPLTVEKITPHLQKSFATDLLPAIAF